MEEEEQGHASRKRRVADYNTVERAHKKGGLLPSLNKFWRQQYLDMGHVRLKRCRERLQTAPEAEIRELMEHAPNVSFMAMAISAASAYPGKEVELLAYAQAVLSRGPLELNDTHSCNPAAVLAAYHGYCELLRVLLDAGCSIDGRGEYGHAIMASVRNGQHGSLRLVLGHPKAAQLLSTPPRASSVLFLAIERRDTMSVRLLRDSGLVFLSNYDFVCLSLRRIERSRFEPMLRELHPASRGVLRWAPEIHWSFPDLDREVLAILWHTMQRTADHPGELDAGETSGPSVPRLPGLPEVIWRHIFSFVERGWWASRQQRCERLRMADVVVASPGSHLEWSHQLGT